MANLEDVKAVKEKKKEEILSRPNVVGVGAGYKRTGGVITGEIVVVAMVRQKLPISALAANEVIPSHVNGVATDVMEVGELRAFQSRTDRWRPAPGSVSLGHYRITAGTYGCMVRDRETGEPLILSNNHILANENDARVDDPILQPGPADGGILPEDTAASLLRFIPLRFEGEAQTGSCLPVRQVAELAKAVGWGSLSERLNNEAAVPVNLVDAAVARPIAGYFLDEILEIGVVSGTVPAALGMDVRKSGRTTALTTGWIQLVSSTVLVNYGEARTARFENQILSSAMSLGGDSGSLLVAAESSRAVGLLFGGSEIVTIYNPIDIVLDLLGVTL